MTTGHSRDALDVGNLGVEGSNLSYPMASFTADRNSRSQRGEFLCVSNVSNWVASNRYEEGAR